MADPINYLAGFNPAQSILQSVQAGIAAGGVGGVGGQSKEELAMQREKMQMQREEFGLSQQLKRDQMAQQKELSSANIALATQTRDLQERRYQQEVDTRNLISQAISGLMSSGGDPQKTRDYHAVLFQFAPESLKAMEDQNKIMRMQVGDEASDAFAAASAKALMLTKAGKTEDAAKIMADTSSALALKASETKNPKLESLANVLATTGNQLMEPGIDPQKAMGAIVLGGSFDPTFRKMMDDMYAQQEKQAQTAKLEVETQNLKGKTLSDKQQEAVMSAQSAAFDASSKLDEINSISDRLNSLPDYKAGLMAELSIKAKNLTGKDRNEAELFKKQLERFTTKEWVAAAAELKGALSDAEGRRFDALTPKIASAGKAELNEYLGYVKKAYSVLNAKEMLRAEAIKQRGDLGTILNSTKEPIDVGGVQVMPGENALKVMDRIRKAPVFSGIPSVPVTPKKTESKSSGEIDRQSLLNKYR